MMPNLGNFLPLVLQILCSDLPYFFLSFWDSDDINIKSFVIISHVLKLCSFFKSIFYLLFRLDISIFLPSSSLIPFCLFIRSLYLSTLKFPFGSSSYLLFLCWQGLFFFFSFVSSMFILMISSLIPLSYNFWCWHLVIAFSNSSSDFQGSWCDKWFLLSRKHLGY